MSLESNVPPTKKQFHPNSKQVAHCFHKNKMHMTPIPSLESKLKEIENPSIELELSTQNEVDAVAYQNAQNQLLDLLEEFELEPMNYSVDPKYAIIKLHPQFQRNLPANTKLHFLIQDDKEVLYLNTPSAEIYAENAAAFADALQKVADVARLFANPEFKVKFKDIIAQYATTATATKEIIQKYQSYIDAKNRLIACASIVKSIANEDDSIEDVEEYFKSIDKSDVIDFVKSMVPNSSLFGVYNIPKTKQGLIHFIKENICR